MSDEKEILFKRCVVELENNKCMLDFSKSESLVRPGAVDLTKLKAFIRAHNVRSVAFVGYSIISAKEILERDDLTTLQPIIDAEDALDVVYYQLGLSDKTSEKKLDAKKDSQEEKKQKVGVPASVSAAPFPHAAAPVADTTQVSARESNYVTLGALSASIFNDYAVLPQIATDAKRRGAEEQKIAKNEKAAIELMNEIVSSYDQNSREDMADKGYTGLTELIARFNLSNENLGGSQLRVAKRQIWSDLNTLFNELSGVRELKKKM